MGRTCLAAGAKLHLVRPFGFSLSEQAVRRAGLDYWQHVAPIIHESAEDFMAAAPAFGAPYALETYGERTLYDCCFEEDVVLIFGRERLGLPPAVKQQYQERAFRIPMFSDHVRSLNLSTSVAIAVYEVVRQRRVSVR